MGRLRVVSPGLLSSVQDLGRSGWSALGVTEGGAADPLSLRAGNRRLGNADDAPAIEMTLTGGVFDFEGDARVALAGPGAAGTIAGGGGSPRTIEPWLCQQVRAGERLTIGAIAGGARAYLCIAGGIDVERTLGSASTHLSAGFGGHEGRALRAGDRLEIGRRIGPAASACAPGPAREFVKSAVGNRTLRAVEGPSSHGFDGAARRGFWSASFAVSAHSDRVGVRLEGTRIAAPRGGRMASEGMPWGAVQVTPSGAPIILGVDHPTTGGYPVIACVAAVDLSALGQLRPRERISFERIALEEARRLLVECERRFDAEFPPA